LDTEKKIPAATQENDPREEESGDPSMVALDSLARTILTVPKSKLDALILSEQVRNKKKKYGKRLGMIP